MMDPDVETTLPPVVDPPLMCKEPGHIFPVPVHLRTHLAPAEWCIYEWTEYRTQAPGATHLQIGSTRIEPILDDVFVFSLDNQLGLTTIMPYRDDGAIGPGLRVEVLARKFATPGDSLRFLAAMLDDLFAQGSTLPFILAAATQRQVRDAFRPPNDLFAFHFFRHHGDVLVRATQAIVGHPHRRLADESAMVRPHQVRKVEPETMSRMLRTAAKPDDMPAPGHTLTVLERLRPDRIWQRIPAETYDTPENRFVLSAGRSMLSSIERLHRASWFFGPGVSDRDRVAIRDVNEHLRALVTDPRFAMLDASLRVPAQSRVLQRRDGYRELSLLWQAFQRAPQPVFEEMEAAIDLGNVADLFEFWVLFELIAKIREHTGIAPRLSSHTDVFGRPTNGLCARFGDAGTLHYNRTFTGYSGIKLRPDYIWERPDGDLVVMDAKFRMSAPPPGLTHDLPDDLLEESPVAQTFKDDDIQKMHTYRDAIARVRAAIVLYPGTETMFRTTSGIRHLLTLADILDADLDGIGALPLSPVSGSAGGAGP